MNAQLSKNFSRAEFSCRCGCGFGAIDPALVTGLQVLRDTIGKPIVIVSGCRCAKHNAKVGGAAKSQHVSGKAADIRVAGIPPRLLYVEASRVPQFRGFGVDDERGFLHVDTRPVTARWCYERGREIPWREA
jgi:uncharacterized protein YcbK (DUF882 family)